MNWKKSFLYGLSILLLAFLAACGNSEQESSSEGNSSEGSNAEDTESDSSSDSASEEEYADYPKQDIRGVIPFGAGGSADTVARAIAPLAEEELSQSLVMENVTGGTGSIATQEVYDNDADGYTLLFAAENQNLYRTTGISELSFNDFEPIMQFGRAVPVIVTQPDAEWDSISEVLNQVEEDPGSVSMMTTGPVGLSGVVTSMLDKEFNMIPYEGSGEGITALMGGQVDVGVVGLPSAVDYAESGKLKVLSVVNDEPLEDHPDWPALAEERPEYAEYLPWGPYYGVYAKEGTPDPILEKLESTFEAAYETDEFQEFLDENGTIPMGYTGEKAMEFQRNWESTTNWLLYNAGEAEDPSQYDIPKPENLQNDQ